MKRLLRFLLLLILIAVCVGLVGAAVVLVGEHRNYSQGSFAGMVVAVILSLGVWRFSGPAEEWYPEPDPLIRYRETAERLNSHLESKVR